MKEIFQILDIVADHLTEIVEFIWRALVIFLLYNICKHIEYQTNWLKGEEKVYGIGNDSQ